MRDAATNPVLAPDGGTVIATFLRDLPRFVETRGTDLEPFANAARLATRDFSDRTKRVSLAAVCRLLSGLSTVLGQETLGIEYGRFRTGGASGAFGQGFVSAPTIKHMLLFYTKYVSTVVDHRSFDAAFDRTEVAISWDYSPLVAHTDEFADAALVSFLKVLEGATNGRQRYRSFELRRATPQDPSAFRAVYPANIVFGTSLNRIVLSASELSARNPYANEVLHEMMCAECDTRLHALRVSKPLVTALKEEILETLGTERFSIVDAASKVGMSVRTLQRRLKEDQLTFDELVETARFNLIEAKLSETREPLGQVAEAVGYSDQSAFTRAVVKKYGCSPSELRRRLSGR